MPISPALKGRLQNLKQAGLQPTAHTRAANTIPIDSVRLGVGTHSLLLPLFSPVNGDVHGLDLLVVAQAVLAQLAAPARLLETTEGRCHVKVVEAVDPNGSSAEGMRRLERPSDVAGADARSETVVRCVGALDRIVDIPELEDAHDRPKDLLLGDNHVVVHITEDRWLHVEARVVGAVATGQHSGALRLALLDVVHDLVELDLVHDGPLQGLGRRGVAGGPALGRLCRRAAELVVDVLVHE
mmetsp:Transcript_97340/g.225654  ORF Transcript_97340/g.225654 Transcript_97340/m.225654 type:complete len:241 (+) Transcript_97340:70-792(+)